MLVSEARECTTCDICSRSNLGEMIVSRLFEYRNSASGERGRERDEVNIRSIWGQSSTSYRNSETERTIICEEE